MSPQYAGYDAPGVNGISPTCPNGGIYYLQGTASDQITFGGTLPPYFSWCVVSRYVAGQATARIVSTQLASAPYTVLLGHYAGYVRTNPAPYPRPTAAPRRSGRHSACPRALVFARGNPSAAECRPDRQRLLSFLSSSPPSAALSPQSPT